MAGTVREREVQAIVRRAVELVRVPHLEAIGAVKANIASRSYN